MIQHGGTEALRTREEEFGEHAVVSRSPDRGTQLTEGLPGE